MNTKFIACTVAQREQLTNFRNEHGSSEKELVEALINVTKFDVVAKEIARLQKVKEDAKNKAAAEKAKELKLKLAAKRAEKAAKAPKKSAKKVPVKKAATKKTSTPRKEKVTAPVEPTKTEVVTESVA